MIRQESPSVAEEVVSKYNPLSRGALAFEFLVCLQATFDFNLRKSGPPTPEPETGPPRSPKFLVSRGTVTVMTREVLSSR
jgi:hypothetical protein